MTRAVFFDWFNTLAEYDPPREVAHAAACRLQGIQVEPEQLAAPLLKVDQYFYQENARSPITRRSPAERDEVFGRYEVMLLREAGIEVAPAVALAIVRQAMKSVASPRFVLYPDVLPTMEALKKLGLVIGLISNIQIDIMPVCAALGLAPYLDFSITSQEAGADKPDPAIFRAALKKGKVDAADTVYVGDQYSTDVVGARGAGLKPVLLDRHSRHADISDCPRITTLGELLGLL